MSTDPWQRSQAGRMRHLVALHAGVGQPSSSQMLTERLAEATRRALEARSHLASIRVVALRESAVDITRAALGGAPRGELAELLNATSRADAVIAVTPVFQASMSGLFKSFLDILPEGALTATPVLLGATAGTARHSLVPDQAMRPVFAHLKAATLPSTVFAASEDFGAAWEGGGTQAPLLLAERIARAGEELADWMERFPSREVSDPLADFTPMEELLGRH